MVKRSLSRKAEKLKPTTPPRAKGAPGQIAKDSAAPTLHRGRKKRQHARDNLKRKKSFIATELARLEADAAKKRERVRQASAVQHGASRAVLSLLRDMDAALPTTEKGEEKAAAGAEDGEAGNGEQRSKAKRVRHKARRRIAAEETVQLRRVRAHDGFRADPVEALRQHLANTVAADAGEPPAPVEEGKAAWRRARRGKAAVKPDAGLVAAQGSVEKACEQARELVREKRERKAEMAEAAVARSRRKRAGGGIGKQSLKGLMGGRGRIGEKRDKVLG